MSMYYSQEGRCFDKAEYIEYNHFQAQWSCENSLKALVSKVPGRTKWLNKQRIGTYFTVIQLDELERFYVEKFDIRKKGRFLTIAKYLNLTEYEVAAWFKNRTLKEKRDKLRAKKIQKESVPAESNEQSAVIYTHSPVDCNSYQSTSHSPSYSQYENPDFFGQSQQNIEHPDYPFDFITIEAELMRSYEFETLQNGQSDVLEEFSNVNFDELKQLHSCNLTPCQSELLNPAYVLDGIDQSEFWQYI